jgi:hypothetical protein
MITGTSPIFKTHIEPLLKSKMLQSSVLTTAIASEDISIDEAKSAIDELMELNILSYVNGISGVFIFLTSDKVMFANAIEAINEAVKVNNEGNSGFFNSIENVFKSD